MTASEQCCSARSLTRVGRSSHQQLLTTDSRSKKNLEDYYYVPPMCVAVEGVDPFQPSPGKQQQIRKNHWENPVNPTGEELTDGQGDMEGFVQGPLLFLPLSL